MKRIITRITIATLTFLTGILVVTSNTHAQSLDPNNPAARPNADVLREMGISVVRIVLKDDQNTRDYVKQMQDNGIRVIGIISWEYNSAAYHPGGAVSSEYVARFSDAVRQAYATYGGLYSYQVWNEPDSTGPADQGTSKVIPPESYGQLLAAATAVLHGNNQHVLSAGFISGNDAYLRAVIASLGGVFPADGVAIHPYVPDPSQPGSIESVIAWITAMNILTGKDVFITEYGWGTSDQQAQADWLLAVQNLLTTQPSLALAMWYGWSDAQVAGLGLFDINGNPKLAALVLQSLLLNGVAPGDLRALVDAGLIVECKTLAGEFMGYAYNQAQCALFVPCLDKDGNVLGYAMSQAFCSEKQKLRACSGPINLEQKLYDREIIGFGSGSASKPWELEAVLKNQFKTPVDVDDADWDDLVADTIVANLKVEPAKYQHTDFTSWISQRWGSLNGGDDNYIENKAKNVFFPNEEQSTMPLQYALFAPGTNIPGNFTVNRQEFIKNGESASTYTKRVMGSQDGELGYKASITNPIFRGCIQAAVCDPRYEEDCLVKMTTEKCDKDTHSINDCIGGGKEIDLVPGDDPAGISYIEPPQLHAMSRGMWIATSAIVQDPNKSVMEGVPGTRDNSGFVTSKSSYAQTATDKIYADRSSPVSSTSTKQPEPLASEDKTYVAKAYAQGPPPYGNDPAPYCQGMRLLIENKGTEYAVKAWSDMADGCLMAPDWAGEVTYYLNGQKIGGCTIPKHQSAGIPRWDPDGDDDERYGMSVSDQLSGPCKVPITPSTPGVLSVEFRITESSEPGDVAGCYKTPYCECPPGVESCRSTELPKPPRIVNCQLCNSWAPAEYCNTINVDDLKEIDECAEGYCISEGTEIVLGESSEYEEEAGSLIEWLAGLMPGDYGWFWDKVKGDHRAYEFSCSIGGNILDWFDIDCGFNMREVYLYGYIDNGQVGPPGLMGNLDQYRSVQDIQVYNGLSMIPGINEEYFDLKPTRHQATLRISIGETLDTNVDDYKAKNCEGNINDCLSLKVAGGDDLRDFYIEYPDHYEQMAAHCVTQAQLSIETDDFPESQAEFCEPILDQLRDPDVKQSLLNKNRFDKLAVYSGGVEATPSLASDKNKPVVAEVNVNKPTQAIETTTSEEKYELLASKLTTPSTVGDNQAIKSLESDLKIIFQKYIYKYGVDALIEMKNNNKPPEDLILELKELEKTYNL